MLAPLRSTPRGSVPLTSCSAAVDSRRDTPSGLREPWGTAATSALLFAVGSWLIIEHWVYPRLLATLRAFGDQGLATAAQRDAHPVLRLCMPYLCIALAQLAGSLALSHPRLAGASLPRRTLFLGIAIFAGWLTAVVAFVPPGLTSVLVFTPPVLILLVLSWLAAAPIALLLRRRHRA